MALVSLFDHGAPPTLTATGAADYEVTVGVVWRSLVPGAVNSLWVYVANTSLGGKSSSAVIYQHASPHTELARKDFTFQASVGWQEIVLDEPLLLSANTQYVAAIYFPDGYFAVTGNYFLSARTSGPLTAPVADSENVNNGRFMYDEGVTFPAEASLFQANYWVDIEFDTDNILTIELSSASDEVGVNNSVAVTAEATGGSDHTYSWTVVRGTGTFDDATADSTTYTPTSLGRHVLWCTATVGLSESTSGFLIIESTAPDVTVEADFTATATDTLDAEDSAGATLSVTRGGRVTRQQRSLYGNRLSFGDATTNKVPVISTLLDLPGTYVIKTYIQRDCTLTKIRFMKAPLGSGRHTVIVWRGSDTTPLRSQTVTLVADDGGWVEVVLEEPLDLEASDQTPYLIGYHTESGHIRRAEWVYGSQAIVEYPFVIEPNGGNWGNVEAYGYAFASTPSYPSTWSGHSVFIDPVVEWESDDAVYTGGTEYLQQFSAYKDIDYFPIGVWQPLPGSIAGFATLGINTVMGPGGQDSAANRAITRGAIISNNMDVFMSIEGSSSWSAIAQWQADPTYYDRIKGYFIRDEPDMVGPWTPPAELKDFMIEIRKRDATKTVVFNFGKWPVVNKGFAALPTGASPGELNAYWREFAQIPDILSCDFYMEDSANHEGSYGLWCNPRIIGRLRDLSDSTRPVWHYIATTAAPERVPTPATVYRSTWAALIGGARGIVFFDHQFTSNNTWLTDFAMSQNAPMAAMVQAMTAEIQSLSGPLMAAEANMVVTVASSNTTTGPVGGTWGVPIHFAARKYSGDTFLFTQAIRPGSTTATFTVPEAASKTITVLGESRTLSADGNGVFSDSFASDYQVHLYRWT